MNLEESPDPSKGGNATTQRASRQERACCDQNEETNRTQKKFFEKQSLRGKQYPLGEQGQTKE